MEHYCQLLVDDEGHVCLPYREWNDASVMKECNEPAVHWLDNSMGDGMVFICAEHFDKIQRGKDGV